MLFVNLSDAEWVDMGISSKFHIRKLQLIMPQYRTRYQQRQARRAAGREHDDNSDDDISEYSPSELSEIIAQEGISDDDDEEEQVRYTHLWCIIGTSIIHMCIHAYCIT